MYQNKIITILIFSIVIFVSNCQAENNNYDDRKWDLSIGLGYGNSSNPFVGADDVPNYLSLDFSIYGKRFFFDNGELGFTVVEKPNFGINIITTYNSERIYYSYFNEIGISVINTGENFILNEETPITIVDPIFFIPAPMPSPLPPSVEPLPLGIYTIPFDIQDKSFSLNLGAEVIYDNEFGSFNFQTSKDVSGVHSGADIITSFSKSWKRKKWKFGLNLGLHWKSSKLVNYYYGFDNETNSFFDYEYNPTDSLDSFLGIVASYRLTNHLSMVSSIKYNHFGDAIRNSPIIDSRGKSIVFTGLVYRF